MHELYKVKEKLVKELSEMSNSDLTKSNLDLIDKLAHAGKNVTKLIESCEKDEYGTSESGTMYSDRIGERYVRPDGSYRDGGMSEARGRRNAPRDAMGRYSGDGVDEHTKRELIKLIEKM